MLSALEADFRVGRGRASQERFAGSFKVRPEEGAEVASLDCQGPSPVDRTDRQFVAQPRREALKRWQVEDEVAEGLVVGAAQRQPQL